MEEYSTFDIVKGMGIKIEKLKDWMNRGYIRPSVQKARGSGTKNLFNKNDLYQLGLFMFLIARGFSRDEAARHAGTFHEILTASGTDPEEEMGRDGFLILAYKGGQYDDARIMNEENGRIAIEKDNSYDELLLINCCKIQQQVDSAIQRIKRI